MNSSPPLSSQTLREIYVNVLASFPPLSLSLLDIHYNIKKEGEKRGGKKSGGKKRRKKERHTREPKRERNLKKLENRRTRGKPEATVIPMDWTRKAVIEAVSGQTNFPPEDRIPKSGQVQLLPEGERENLAKRGQANKSSHPQCQLNDSRSVPRASWTTEVRRGRGRRIVERRGEEKGTAQWGGKKGEEKWGRRGCDSW